MVSNWIIAQNLYTLYKMHTNNTLQIKRINNSNIINLSTQILESR